MSTFDKIKEILKNGSNRCVIFCGDEPRYVAMTWQEYKTFANIIKIEENDYSGIDINNIPL